MKREDRKTIIKVLVVIFIIVAIGGKYIYDKWQIMEKISTIDKSDEYRIAETEKKLEKRYKLSFTYKGIDYHNGEKFYLFSLDKAPEIEVRANYKTTIQKTVMAIFIFFDITQPLYDNYSQKVTEYTMNQYQINPVDISDMTKKQAEAEILKYYRVVRSNEIENKYKTDLDQEFEIVAIYKGKRIYFDQLISKSILEELTDLGLPD